MAMAFRQQGPNERRSRADSQAATREQLLATAERLILSCSIPGLSLRQLCAEAGYTQGAFYSNFNSKDALLLAVMQRHLAEQHQSLSALAAQADVADLDSVLAAFGGWLRASEGRHGWAAVAIELRLHALRDAGFGAELCAAEAPIVQAFAALIDSLVQRFGLAPSTPADAIAQTLIGFWYSMAIRDMPVEMAEELCLRLVRMLLDVKG